MDSHIAPVALDKAHRLINHGPTVLVSARMGAVSNVMAAAWACALDFTPPKLTVVVDKAARTRQLMEESGRFVVQVPTVAQAQLVYDAGNISLRDDADKLAHCGVTLFDIENRNLPCVAGCAAWLECRLIPEAHNQQAYDLFIAEVTGAWADPRVFRDGHWLYESADPALRSLHYVAGGQFYTLSDRVVPVSTREG